MKSCCKDHNNLELYKQNTERLIYKCKVCGCRHFHMKARGMGDKAHQVTRR